MLKDYTLFGVVDKVKVAIDRLKSFEDVAIDMHPDGYYVCDSGGKDSLVIVDLAIRAGVKCDFHHNHTTVDHPETVRYVRRRKKEIEAAGYKYTIHKPDKSMWRLISEKGLPTRFRRWCCEYLKEGGGAGRAIVTGVRRAESSKRSTRGAYEAITPKQKDKVIRNNDNDETRQAIETCPAYNKIAVNPIIDWTDDDVWNYIRGRRLPYNTLYDNGYKRVGCVGCPLASNMKQELEDNPKYFKLYRGAMKRYIDKRPEILEKYGWRDVDDAMCWWLSGLPTKRKGQIEMDFEE